MLDPIKLAQLGQAPPMLSPVFMQDQGTPLARLPQTASPNVISADQPIDNPHLAHTIKIADGMGGPITASIPSTEPTVVQDPNPLNQIEGHLTNKLQKAFTKEEQPKGFWGKTGDVLANVINAHPVRDQNNEMMAQLENVEKQKSEQALQGATAGHLAEETKEMPETSAADIGEKKAHTAQMQSEIEQGPNLATAYSHAVNQAIKEGRDPSTDPIVQHLSDAITSIQKDAVPKSLQSTKLEGPNGKPFAANYHPDTGKYTDVNGKEILNPIPYEKPNVTNINAGEHAWEYANNQLNTLGKPIGELNMRMGRLKDTIAQGTPQADALVAPELLTVMAGGQGSGLRMNEAEIARIVGGRSHWENLKASIQKWSLDPSTANSITTEQRGQVHALISAVDAKIQKKISIINDSANKLVDVSDPTQQHRILADTRQALQAVDTGDQSNQGGANTPPPGATQEAWKDGKLIGHVVTENGNQRFVPLGVK